MIKYSKALKAWMIDFEIFNYQFAIIIEKVVDAKVI